MHGIADQLFSSYSKVQEVRALEKVLGENDLTDLDRDYIKFGKAFEEKFINQESHERRTIYETLNLAEDILKILPREEWDKIK